MILNASRDIFGRGSYRRAVSISERSNNRGSVIYRASADDPARPEVRGETSLPYTESNARASKLWRCTFARLPPKTLSDKNTAKHATRNFKVSLTRGRDYLHAATLRFIFYFSFICLFARTNFRQFAKTTTLRFAHEGRRHTGENEKLIFPQRMRKNCFRRDANFLVVRHSCVYIQIVRKNCFARQT